jgi:hypothetical protein
VYLDRWNELGVMFNFSEDLPKNDMETAEAITADDQNN